MVHKLGRRGPTDQGEDVLKFVLLTIGAPAIAGTATAGALMFGVVQTQTAEPSQNPAAEPVISYGDRS